MPSLSKHVDKKVGITQADASSDMSNEQRRCQVLLIYSREKRRRHVDFMLPLNREVAAAE